MIVFMFTLLVLLNFFLQSSVLPYISVFGAVPNTSIIIIICISLFKGRFYGAIFGLIIGLLQDIIFSPIIGINAFIYFFLGYFIGTTENKVIRDNVLIPIIFSMLAVIYYNFSYYIFTYFLSQEIPFLSFAKKVLLVEMVYTTLLSIPVYKTFNRVFTSPKISFTRKKR